MGEVKQVQFGSQKAKDSKENVKAQRKDSEAPVLDMGAFRTRKSLSADRKSSVSETFSGITSRGSESSVESGSSEMELSDRIERIKGSIQRINQLMAELRGVAPDSQSKN
jgi:hypothetical protein